ncbi:MAG: O-antigen ligase family protein [Candidatus Odinarchaeota archaeon]
MNREKIGDNILSYAAFLQIAVLMLQELLISSNIVTYESFEKVSLVLSAIPMVIAAFITLKRNFILFLFTYLIFVSLILITLIVFPNNEKYVKDELFYLFFINIPCFLCLATIQDIYILKKVMLKLSYVIFILGIIYVYFLWVGMINFLSYSMTLSYYLLLPALIFINHRGLLFSILFLFICLIMLMLGSRGALVTALVYALLLLLFDKKKRITSLIFIISLIVLSGSLIISLQSIADMIGVNSRTLRLILEGDIAYDSDRLELYSIIWKSILTNPIKGYGLFGDRVILDGVYTHNFILELLNNFGLILGSGLIFILFYKLIRIIYRSDVENKKLLLLFFCYCLIPLMFSSSYLKDPRFGILIGAILYYEESIKTGEFIGK